MEFHVTNTFLQTFILVCVGYFSYFFDVENFTDRIMVVLTTMLVVATVTTSIQDVSKAKDSASLLAHFPLMGGMGLKNHFFRPPPPSPRPAPPPPRPPAPPPTRKCVILRNR